MLKSQLLRFNTSPLQRVRTVGNTGCASDRAHARTEIHFHLARTARSGAEQNERTNGGDCRPGSTCQLLHNPRLDLSRILGELFSRETRDPLDALLAHTEKREIPESSRVDKNYNTSNDISFLEQTRLSSDPRCVEIEKILYFIFTPRDNDLLCAIDEI